MKMMMGEELNMDMEVDTSMVSWKIKKLALVLMVLNLQLMESIF